MKNTLTLLLVLFIGLKLTNQIDWSWWWVTSPGWIPLAIGLFGLSLQGIGWLLMTPEQRDRERIARRLRKMADHYKR